MQCTVLQDATAGDKDKTAWYKASEEGTTAKTAWGQKPAQMGNGQDFWVQLKKQVASVQLGG